jgi:hypothetical protein
MNIVKKSLICFFANHKPVPMLVETEYGIYGKGCKRCKCPLGLPKAYKNPPPPPNSSKEQLDSWYKFLDNLYIETREEIKKQENDFKNFNES